MSYLACQVGRHIAAAALDLAADVAALGADIWRDVRELAAEMLTGRIPL